MITLQNAGRTLEAGQGRVHRRAPIRVGEIAAQVNAAGAPGAFRETGRFDDQLALFLGKHLELLPVGQIELGDDRLRRERSRINDPGVGNQLEQPVQKTFAQLAPPELAQIAVPQKGKQHFLLENRFGRRREPDAFIHRRLEHRVGGGHVRQIEQLEEAIDRFAVGKCKSFLVPQKEAAPARVELVTKPVHLRPIRRGFIRDYHVHRRGVPENSNEPAQHSVGAAQNACADLRVG